MRLSLSVDMSGAQRMVRRFPRAVQAAEKRFIEKVGRTLEGKAKREAPVVTGNLRRMIDFRKNKVIANANYSKYVHGAPYHTNRTRRRETPFFTYALMDSKTAIAQHARGIIRDIESVI